jgi:hypothetical protein
MKFGGGGGKKLAKVLWMRPIAVREKRFASLGNTSPLSTSYPIMNGNLVLEMSVSRRRPVCHDW